MRLSSNYSNSIVDGAFVGNGIATNALGAIGLVMPFVNAIIALMMLINVGGATIFAIQIKTLLRFLFQRQRELEAYSKVD